MTIKAKSRICEDKCPMCASERLHVVSIHFHVNSNLEIDKLRRECLCRDCDFDFQQWFKTKFDSLTAYSGMKIDNII